MCRASWRIFSLKSLEPIPGNAPRILLQALEREGILRKFSTQVEDSPQEVQNTEEPLVKHPIAKVQAKMRIMFTCRKCETRNSKVMTKLAYEKGVVIIKCDGCKNNHLIADNLGWFGPVEAKRNIEKIMKMQGHTVKRLQVYGSDTFEVVKKDEKMEMTKDEPVEIPEGQPLPNR
ncbi:DNL-type zinc finger protein-like isoform X2 [Fopius arisanus]|nr:PREDICTED: DNL-type zinc finger protein-like isoform X2 [Fopius arisanus]